jgi:tRNA threonylcarbamoyladenosine biosynthesis protein TsaE
MMRFLPDSEATEQFGGELWRLLPEKSLIYLQGPLGSGKTTLVRGVLRAAGFKGAVKSPTYTLVEEYLIGQRKILHFDLYRLSNPEELEWIGIGDYLSQNALCFIEWPEMGEGWLSQPDRIITLKNESFGRTLAMEIKSG